MRWAPWQERFEANVDRTPGLGPKGDCHLWRGAASGYAGNRYGTITIAGNVRRAHQVAWEIANGEPFPPGKLGLHSCDEGLCVNAAHIRPGTHKENTAEARQRGRRRHVRPPTNRARGEDHPRAAFTDDDIRWIRSVHEKDMMSVADLSREFSVRWSTIDKIVKRQTWRHIQ